MVGLTEYAPTDYHLVPLRNMGELVIKKEYGHVEKWIEYIIVSRIREVRRYG